MIFFCSKKIQIFDKKKNNLKKVIQGHIPYILYLFLAKTFLPLLQHDTGNLYQQRPQVAYT